MSAEPGGPARFRLLAPERTQSGGDGQHFTLVKLSYEDRIYLAAGPNLPGYACSPDPKTPRAAMDCPKVNTVRDSMEKILFPLRRAHFMVNSNHFVGLVSGPVGPLSAGRANEVISSKHREVSARLCGAQKWVAIWLPPFSCSRYRCPATSPACRAKKARGKRVFPVGVVAEAAT